MGLENALRWCDNHPEIGVLIIPKPAGSRRLDPIVRNIPDDVLFLHDIEPGSSPLPEDTGAI